MGLFNCNYSYNLGPDYNFYKYPKILVCFFRATPKNTTSSFSNWFTIIPFLIVAISFLVIFLNLAFEKKIDVAWIAPLFLNEFMMVLYDSKANKKSNNNVIISLEELKKQKIMNKERLFIRKVTVFALVCSYSLITASELFIKDINGYVFFMSISIVLPFTVLATRSYIYFEFIKKENNATLLSN